MEIGDKVKVRNSKENGVVIKSELKRFSHINNGKQIRIITVLLDNGTEMEYELTDLRKEL